MDDKVWDLNCMGTCVVIFQLCKFVRPLFVCVDRGLFLWKYRWSCYL